MRPSPKNIFIILVLLSFITVYHTFSQSRWIWQNPSPQGTAIISSSFANAYTGFACGNGGTLIKTTNGGLNWFLLETQIMTALYSIDAVDENNVFACGSGGYYIKTTDGGLTWQIFSSGVNQMTGIDFLNANTGFMGSQSDILKTTNGGINFTRYIPNYNSGITGISFVNTQTGYIAVGLGFRIQKTTNSGMNWVNIYASSSMGDNSSGILFINQSTGFACGVSKIAKTTDEGVTWSEFDAGIQIDFSEVSFSGATGYACGYLGKLYTTTNYGVNWSASVSGITNNLYTVFATGSTSACALGSVGNALYTSNSGSGWINTTTRFTNININDIYFLDQNTGYIVCDSGKIYKTNNSGNNWVSQNSGVSATLFKVHFVNNNTGFAGGSGGIILKTDNGGINWVQQNSGTSSMILAFSFVNSLTGYFTSNNNLYKTTNSGENWNFLASPQNNWLLFTVRFTDPQTGFMSNGIGKIFKSTNAGDNWTEIYQSAGGSISDIAFVNNNTGYVAGVNSTVVKTTNGGLSWVQYTVDPLSSLPGGFNNIEFADENNGFIGLPNKMFKTTNGGVNWFIYQGNFPTVSAMYMLTPDICYLAGFGGSILRTNTEFTYINNNNTGIPNKYSLEQNFPNPFNPVTKIKFSIPSLDNTGAVFVKISVYDILGRQIRVLLEKDLLPGRHEISFDGTGLTSGVYLYKIDTPEFTETKKLVLIR